MALWDKVKLELDRAGRAAQVAIDEGKLRLEVIRVRQLADKAAQALGYAVYRARKAGAELDADTYARLSSTLAAREADAERMEKEIAEITGNRKSGPTPASDARADTAPSSPPPAGGTPAT